jgi:hypothetical protein
MLILLGVLSQRLGRVMHAAPYYIGFYVAATLMGMACIIRLIRLMEGTDLPDNATATFIYHALVASGITIGLGAGWRYWSWLLAERD